MKISVLITTWNCGPYLEACRESISTAKSKCSADVEVLEVENGNGVWNARNELLQRASGDWICFVDGDDLIAPDWFCEIEKQATKDASVDLIIFRLDKFQDGTSLDSMSKKYCPFPAYWTACAYRRSVIPDDGFSQYVIHEDDLFLIKSIRGAKHIVDLNVVVYHYRQHHGSSSWRKPDQTLFFSKLNSRLDWLQEYSLMGNNHSSFMRQRKGALRFVLRNGFGTALFDLLHAKLPLWDEWFKALDKLSQYSRFLPTGYRLRLKICRKLRLHWIHQLLMALPTRLEFFWERF